MAAGKPSPSRPTVAGFTLGITVLVFGVWGCEAKLKPQTSSGHTAAISDEPPAQTAPSNPTDPSIQPATATGVSVQAPTFRLDVAAAYQEGESVNLVATILDQPEGSLALLQFTRTAGSVGPATAAGSSLQFLLPQASAAYSVSYKLSGTLDGNPIVPKDFVISVSADDDPPTADAGPDQAIDEEMLVTLTGTGSSDPEGAALTYSWSQVLGPSVTLSNSSAAQPTFTAPDDATDYTLGFELVVDDGTNASIVDDVMISVHALNANLIPAAHRGAFARACGFDMNHDGIVGTPADCHVCDGMTTDPDGDGQAEDMWYVDASSGSDAPTCGSPASPCHTIQYALDAADGSGIGQEEIFCLAGAFNESITKILSGKTTSYARDGFEYPSNPVMLVGWDKDQDGKYPPSDTDDAAEIVGVGSSHNFFDAGSSSYLEMAHLTIKNISAPGQWDAGIYYADTGGGVARGHVYLHDLTISDVNAGAADGYLFNFGNDKADVDHVAIENVVASNFGTGFFHLSSPNHTSSGLRIRNDTIMPHATTNLGFYLTAHVTSTTDVSFDHNKLDINYSAWTPDRTIFLNLGNCSKRVSLVANDLLDVSQVLNAFLDGDACATPTTQDEVSVVDNFVLAQASSAYAVVSTGYRAPGSTDDQTFAFADFLVQGNTFIRKAGNPSTFCVASTSSNSVGVNPGTTTILANTCIGLGLLLGDSVAPFMQSDFEIRDNLITGLDALQLNFLMYSSGPPPTNFVASHNIYDSAGKWSWTTGDQLTLAGWQTATSADASSLTCLPAFVNAAAGNYHLAPGDTCAKDAGVAHVLLQADADGDAFPATGIDIGADQI